MDPSFPIDIWVESLVNENAFTFDFEHDPNVSMYDKDLSFDDVWGCGFCCNELKIYITDLSLAKNFFNFLYNYQHENKKENLFPTVIAHNAKYDLKWAKLLGWFDDYPHTPFDTMLAANLLNENLKPNQIGLKPLAKKLFKADMGEFKDQVKYGRHSKQFKKYAEDDVYYEHKLYKIYKDKLDEHNLSKYFHKVLMPSMLVFCDVELNGLPWDKNEADMQILNILTLQTKLYRKMVKEIGYINFNSTKQLRERFFGELGFSPKGIPLTPGGELSLSADVLENLAKKYPVCNDLVLYRKAGKLVSTYLEAGNKHAEKYREGRVRSNFWLSSTTGRTRSSDLNVQNQITRFPKEFGDVNVRRCFKAPEGKTLIVADFSQLELRLCAHITKDKNLSDAYLNYFCTNCGCEGQSAKILHSCPECGAAENEEILKDKSIKAFWHGADLHQITADSVGSNRSAAKAMNFALIYYATPYRLHMEHPAYSVDQWEEWSDKWFAKYPGVREFHKKQERILTTTRTCRDLFGRRRIIPRAEITASPGKYKHCLNQIINFPVQSSGSSLGQYVGVKQKERLQEKGWWNTKAKYINFVHDEVVYEVDDDIVDEVNKIIVDTMENTIQFSVPIRTDSQITPHWGIK